MGELAVTLKRLVAEAARGCQGAELKEASWNFFHVFLVKFALQILEALVHVGGYQMWWSKHKVWICRSLKG